MGEGGVAMIADVTVVIPTIPPRSVMLGRALRSVRRQSATAAATEVVIDTEHAGAWATRNRGIASVRTEWTAFLDDDDEFMPHHIQHLLNVQAATGADVCWGWFEVKGGTDPFPHYRGRQYDRNQPHIVPITYLARTELLQAALRDMGGFQPDGIGAWDTQDMPLLHAMLDLGATFNADERDTWIWHHHGANTSGIPTRW